MHDPVHCIEAHAHHFERPVPGQFHIKTGFFQSMHDASILSNHSLIGKAEVLVFPNDDVIQHTDPDQAADFHEPACNLEIFRTGSRVAARVIVNTEQAGCGRQDGWTKDLPGMNQRSRQRPLRDPIQLQESVLSVQKYGPETLFSEVDHAGLEMTEYLQAARELLTRSQSRKVESANKMKACHEGPGLTTPKSLILKFSSQCSAV